MRIAPMTPAHAGRVLAIHSAQAVARIEVRQPGLLSMHVLFRTQ
jgi:hypothetical protein